MSPQSDNRSQRAGGRGLALSRIFDYAILYSVLVAFGIFFEYVHGFELKLFTNNSVVPYDPSRFSDYRWTEFITPLALLPMGTTVKTGGNFLCIGLSALIFIPTPIVFIPLVTSYQYWTLYPLFFSGFFLIAVMSNFYLINPIRPLSAGRMLVVADIFMAMLGIALLLAGITSGLHFASFADINKIRGAANPGALGGYATQIAQTSGCAVMVAFYVVTRRLRYLFAALLFSLLVYGIMASKTAAFAVIWIFYFYLCAKYFSGKSTVRTFVCFIFPLIMLSILDNLFSGLNSNILLKEASGLVMNRMYDVPAMAFDLYYIFFQSHPVTYWSHINGISAILTYPYKESLGILMQSEYNLGAYNASFLSSDVLAAYGIGVLPVVCGIFGAMLILINTALQAVPIRVCFILLAVSVFTIASVPMSTAFVSGGLFLLCAIFSYMPRTMFSNLAEAI